MLGTPGFQANAQRDAAILRSSNGAVTAAERVLALVR